MIIKILICFLSKRKHLITIKDMDIIIHIIHQNIKIGIVLNLKTEDDLENPGHTITIKNTQK